MNVLEAPSLFARVEAGLFRSTYPVETNHAFLRGLSLKTVMCLAPRIIDESLRSFCTAEGIELHAFDVGECSEPFQDLDCDSVLQAVSVAAKSEHRPLLIMCDTGKISTGCVVAVLRLSQNWSLTAALDEFSRFTGTSGPLICYQFIEMQMGAARALANERGSAISSSSSASDRNG